MTSGSEERVGAGSGSPSALQAPVAEWLDALVQSSPSPIGVISLLENRYVRANAAMLELYAMSLEELLRTDPYTMAVRVTHPDEMVAEQTLFGELAVGARRFYRIEKRFLRPDGSSSWGLATLSGVFAASADAELPGPLSWVIVHVIDITERKAMAELLERREAEFRHAQKLDALGRLAAGIAHDFNNLLTVITGHAEVLKDWAAQSEGAQDGRPLAEDLGAILAAADRAAALTAQLLTHGRREQAAPRAFVLSELAGTLQRLMVRTFGSNISVTTALDAKGSVFADQGQIGQVVMNLMLNARDALSEGGHIRLETRDVAGDAAPGPGEWVALSVADDGHGMPPEIQARMFEPFFTTRAERPGMRGNGLGLATVQRIVTEAKGRIVVESAPGRGTTVSVFFPREEAPPAFVSSLPPAASLAPVSPRPAPNSRRILVIEDDPWVRALVGTVLLGAFYRVVVASDGAEGMRMLQSDGEPFQLVITDLVMPHVGGVSFARQLQRRASPPRVLFISGYSAHTSAELVQYGGFLPKPFTPAQLLAAVAGALGDAAGR